jgi:hypothetical protein
MGIGVGMEHDRAVDHYTHETDAQIELDPTPVKATSWQEEGERNQHEEKCDDSNALEDAGQDIRGIVLGESSGSVFIRPPVFNSLRAAWS